MKKYFFVFTLLLMAVGMPFTVVSCSSDDEQEQMKEMENREIIETGDVVRFSFCLLDKNGKPSNRFVEGDPFCFNLEITNNCDSPLYGNSGDKGNLILGPDFFCVYSDNGQRIGVPYTGLYCQYRMYWCIVYPNETLSLHCPWGEYGICDIVSGLFCGINNQGFLPSGKYYVSFSVFYHPNSNAKKTEMTEQKIKLNFEII